MNRTGNAKWDALPPKLGRADVENLRFLYVKHGLNWDGAAQSSVAKTLDGLAEKHREIFGLSK